MRKHHINLQPDSRTDERMKLARSRHERLGKTWILNVRLLVWTVVIVLLAAPTLYAVWTVQLRRNTGILSEQAEEFEQEGDLTAAARTLFRYLQFRPDDGPARVLLAEVFDRTATTFAAKARAIDHYYRALSYFEDRLDLRSRLAELLLELDRPKEAERECLRVLLGSPLPPPAELMAGIRAYQDRLQLGKLLESNPEAARTLGVLAKACISENSSDGEWSPTDQQDVITSALAANPKSIELALLQAKMYREVLTEPDLETRARTADEFVTKFLSGHPDVGRASLTLYRYRLKHGLPEADAAIEEALKAAPKDYEVLLAAAARPNSQEKLDDAVEYLNRAIDVSATDPRAYAELARLLLSQGKVEEGIATCRKALERCGQDKLNLNLILLQGLIQARLLSEAEKLLVSVKQKEEAIGPLLKLADRLQLRDAISLLDAELAIAGKKLLRAMAILRQLTLLRSGDGVHADDVQARAQRWRRLAEVYEQLQYWELAAKAYDEVASLSTANYSALVAASRVWQAAGRIDAAIESLETALKASNAQAMGWVLLARAEIERQVRLPNHDWSRVEHALREARRLLDDSSEVMMLDVEVLKAKGNQSAAIELLGKAIEAHPEKVLPFAVLFYQSVGKAREAAKALDVLKGVRNGNDRQVRALEAEFCRRQKDYDRCKVLLGGLISDADAAQKYELRRQLTLVELEQDTEQGKRQLHALAEEYPEVPWAFDRLADLALSQHEYSRLVEHETALEEIEGSDGSLWRFYRAMRLVNQAVDSQDKKIGQAIQLHSELQALRPRWPLTLQLAARIAQQQGKVQEAIEAYKTAIEAGAKGVVVFEGLVTLLYANNRWLEADALLSKLQQGGYQSPMLESYSSRMLLRQGEFDEAVSAAQAGAKLRPRDPLAHFWLGQTLVSASRRISDSTQKEEMLKTAKDAFEHAVALAPEDSRTWSGLLWYFARVGDKGAAARALEGLKSQAKLSAPQRVLALAQAYQLLGEYRLAEQHYLQAVQLLPRDAEAQERLAQFYLTYAPEKAEQAIRRLLELAPASETARRALATLLATQGGDAQFAEAIQLLRASKDDSANRRLQALLLMRRGDKADRAEARRLLDSVISQTISPSATDRQLLAIVAEADGDLAIARQHLLSLATNSGSATHLAALIDFLLRHDRHTDATTYVSRLAELEPGSLRTVQLKAKWLQAMGRAAADIKQTIDGYMLEAMKAARDDRQKLATLSAVTGLYTQMGMQSEAEDCFMKYLQDSSDAGARQLFATWLLKKNRFDDAIQLAMESTAADMPSESSIQLLSNVLAIAANHGHRFASAETRLDELVRARSENANLLLELATLRHMQGQNDIARRLYEQVIQLAPRNAFARNNLAMLLFSQASSHHEALLHIEEALQIAGPLPDLRDTYALVLAHQGKHDDACRILRVLLSQAPRNSRYLFHLAIAYRKAGDQAAAREELEKAKSNNLEAEVLTPAERRLLVELQAEVNK